MMREIFRLWHDRRGAFAPISALVLVIILGLGALSIDMGYNYYMRNKLQVAADASALAGASQLITLIEDGDSQPMTDEALDYADKNLAFADYGNVLVAADVVPGNWDPDSRTFTTPVADPSDLNAVMTTTRRQEGGENNAVPAFLGGIAGFSSYNIIASAIATLNEGDPLTPNGCIMATSSDAAHAFHLFGTADITVQDCGIEIASDDPCALYSNGTPNFSAVLDENGNPVSFINVAGDYCWVGSAPIDPSLVNDGATPAPDPYEDKDPCDEWTLCQQAKDPNYCDNADPAFVNAQFSGTGSAPSGVYCGGIKWTGSGTANFDGDYIIKDGALDIGGNMAINGAIGVNGSGGVGFYLMGTGSVVNFKGESDMNLDAQPVSGGSPMGGFIFYEEDKSPKETHTLRGTNDGGYDGVLYFDGNVELKGTAGAGTGTSDCTVLIANTLKFNGTTALDANSNCNDGADLPPGATTYVTRLVD